MYTSRYLGRKNEICTCSNAKRQAVFSSVTMKKPLYRELWSSPGGGLILVYTDLL